RAARRGDVLATLLTAQVGTVGPDFYRNAALNSLQIDKSAETTAVRYMQQLGHPVQIPQPDNQPPIIEPGVPQPGQTEAKSLIYFPESGYRGEYMSEIAKDILAEFGPGYETAADAERVAAFRAPALQRCLAMQRAALDAFGLY